MFKIGFLVFLCLYKSFDASNISEKNVESCFHKRKVVFFLEALCCQNLLPLTLRLQDIGFVSGIVLLKLLCEKLMLILDPSTHGMMACS